MREVGETGQGRNSCDVLIGFHENPLGVHDAGALQVFDDGAVGIFPELSAQIVFTHAETFGKPGNGDLGGVILVDIADHFVDPVTAGELFDLRRWHSRCVFPHSWA